MGSRLREDKIGTLTENAGNIVLGPSTLTIGGQQYTTTSNIQVALPSLSANTRYQVFAILNAGNVELTISTNENSVGPAGASSWKLVGSFFSNGLSSVGFGSFADIKGPITTELIPYEPVFQGVGTPSNVNIFYQYVTGGIKIQGSFTTGSTTAVEFQLGLPGLTTADTDKIPVTRRAGSWNRVTGTNGNIHTVLIQPNVTYINDSQASNAANPGTPDLGNVFGSSEDEIFYTTTIPIAGYSLRSIEDR